MTIGQIRSTKDDRMSAADVHRRQENQFQRNSARWFRIRKKSDVNVWLHMDGETWTTDKVYLYLGTKGRMETLAERSPALVDNDDWLPVEVTGEVRGRKTFIPARSRGGR